jgi:hypothetical protein
VFTSEAFWRTENATEYPSLANTSYSSVVQVPRHLLAKWQTSHVSSGGEKTHYMFTGHDFYLGGSEAPPSTNGEIANTQNVSIRQLLSCKHTLDVACIHIISRHHTYIQICNAIHASHNRTISLITSIPKIYQYSNSMLYAVISENQFSIPCCRSSFPFNFRITATAMLHIRQLR